jgi:hypothetical protein
MTKLVFSMFQILVEPQVEQILVERDAFAEAKTSTIEQFKNDPPAGAASTPM